MTIWELTAQALSGLSCPKVEGVYIAPSGQALPSLYVVYSLVSSFPELHADDLEIIRSWTVQLSIFNKAGLSTNMPDVDTPMIAGGFIKGAVRELPYNQLTGHFGLAKEFVYIDG